jgi:hypothetical protein
VVLLGIPLNRRKGYGLQWCYVGPHDNTFPRNRQSCLEPLPFFWRLSHEEFVSIEGRCLEALAVVRAEAVTWEDGSLVCPQPGMMYTQALEEGHWVMPKAGCRELDYFPAEPAFKLAGG